MVSALRAGILYFAIVFACGFVLGAIRTLWVIPRFGELLATVIELPIIIALSWFVCRWVLRRISVAADSIPRLTMGAIALALLLAGEAALSITLGGLSLQQHVALYKTLPILLGLAGQILYALFPYAQTSITSRPPPR
jgi:hypothetical protein